MPVTDMMRHYIIGLGEVGSALHEILQAAFEVFTYDIGRSQELRIVSGVKVLHICFPYSSSFIDKVKEYCEALRPEYVVIHSTVPVGTTRQCGKDFVHSPIRGKHPKLAESIKVFAKFFGGQYAKEVAAIFEQIGIQTVVAEKSEETEAMKLWDTEIYREAILLNRKIYQYCAKGGLNFDIVYTLANKTYNEGYSKMGNPEYAKYILKYTEGPIGGHCVEPNHHLLNERFK